MKHKLLLVLLLFSGFWLKSQTLSLSFTNIVNPCGRDGSVTAIVSGGVQPYSYEWRKYGSVAIVSFSPMLANAVAGYYYLKVTDNVGSMVQNSVSLPPPFQVYPSNQIPATCPLNDGSLTFKVVGGTAPYDYVWSSGQTFLNQLSDSSTLSNLAPGQYKITVTDANNCVYIYDNDTMGGVLESVASFSVAVTTTQSTCNNGSAVANISGSISSPFTYYWSIDPQETSSAIYNQTAGSNGFVTVADADGCNRRAYYGIPGSPTNLQVYSSVIDATCIGINNGAINLFIQNGTPPFTYFWSTGATTQNITNVPSGSYTVTVLDSAGCKAIASDNIGDSIYIYASITSLPSDCSTNTGSATVTASGGNQPYNYLWTNGATGATNANLLPGHYGVNVVDNNGCRNYNSLTTYVDVQSSCKAQIEGNIWNDENGNCSLDVNETALPFQILDLGNGLYSSTNSSGQYIAQSINPLTYTISRSPQSGWNLICPSNSYTVTSVPGQTISGFDFYEQAITYYNDIRINLQGGLARPGFNYLKHYSINNTGTNNLSGTVEIKHDPLEIFLGGQNVVAYDSLTQTISLAYYNLAPFGFQNVTLNFSLPASVPLGTILTTTGVVNPTSGDVEPINNYDTSLVTVVGSYDPNVKEVLPKGAGASGLISPNNEQLEYTIHFQNTGTYPAQFVVITDTLDQDLEITSFQLLGASHYLTWELNGPRILKFTFNNINLPDSLSNEPESHGFVSYRINQKPNLSGGTEIKNTAYIYFDYNTPIVTNTALNTIEILSIKENEQKNFISVSPNPAQNRISIKCKNNETCEKIEIIDITGKLILSIVPNNTTIQLLHIVDGIYILNAHYKSGVYKEKIIIHN